MKVKKLTSIDFLAQRAGFQESRLVFSFFESHSKARRAFLADIAQQGWQIDSRYGRFYLAGQFDFDQKTLTITNLLVEAAADFTWKQLLAVTESFARSRFVAAVLWQLPHRTPLAEWFIQQGYQVVPQGYQKALAYQTALVLGGGGAHGAYQIGVWQALQERGITFEWITGTSVGALNGALILMNDVEAAVDLWANISNEQVLHYPLASVRAQTLRDLMNQANSLVREAVKSNGASTEPLARLLQKTFDQEKFSQTACRLLICTTRLPDFKETVYAFDPSAVEENLHWLLASASFYPAMQAQKINDAYYIDGGYRNNLPIDVAVQQGATECITVDVQGPGINKRTVVTEETAQLSLGSPWSLGSFLVFDAQRSLDNMTLGYLETLKVFGKYQGHWYTFERTVDFQPLWRGFLKELRQTDPLLYQELKKKEFWKKMRKFYQQDVPFEQWGRILIECTAKVLYLAPTLIYEQETILTALAEKIALKAVEEADAWSITEWLSYYRDRFFVLSEQNRFFFFYRTQQLNLPALQQIRRRYPLTALMAAYSHYLLKGAENG